MSDKVVVVTGATGSLGAATAKAFAAGGATVVVMGRDEARTGALAQSLRAETNNPRVETVVADLARPASVRKAADELQRRHPRIHVLVNNAAVYKGTRVVTPEGLEAMFATNHLGPFLLTQLLVESLKRAAPSRVLNVTAPSTTKLDFEDLQGARKFSALGAFGASKMENLLFTYALARRLEGSGVTSNAFFPNLVKSDLLREAPGPLRLFLGLISKKPQVAAEALHHLGTAVELEGANARFYKFRKEIQSAPYSRDVANQERLWEVSEKTLASA